MSESETQTEDAQEQSYADEPYGDLMNLARSAREQFDSVEIDTDAPKKDELVADLSEYEPEGSRESGWTIEVDGSREDVDLLNVQTPDKSSNGSNSGPKPKTVFYCLTRKETTDARVADIREALDGSGYELSDSPTGDKYAIVIPVEEQADAPSPDVTKTIEVNADMADEDLEQMLADEAYEMNANSYSVAGEGDSGDEDTKMLSVDFYGVSEDEDDEDAESESDEEDDDDESEDDSSSDGESGTESEEAEEQGESSEEDDEPESDESEAADEQENDDESDGDEEGDTISEDAYRTAAENKSKDELYSLAVEYDIDGRSDMTKSELIDALVEEHPKVE